MRKVIVLDTETTGLVSSKLSLTDRAQPHIVQLSALQYSLPDARVEQSISLIAKPDGWEIPQEAEKVHGISTEFAKANGQKEFDVLKTFLHLWAADGPDPLPLIAHNAKFDKHIISIGIQRFFPDLLGLWLSAPSYCTMEKSKKIVNAKNSRGALKYPKLSEAYEHFFGEQFENAHSANADVVACLKIFLALEEQKNE